MNEILILAACLLLGVAVGTVAFAGLWWTVRTMPGSRHPALLVVASFLARLGLIAVALWFAAQGGAAAAIACGVGLIVARHLVVRGTHT